MALNALIKINGTEITEHNRTFSSSLIFDNNDTELASGNMRRFYKPKKNSFNFDWSYLPNKAAKTVDERVGRDFLHSLVNAGAVVVLSVQSDEKDVWNDYNCLITSYSENMTKNVLQSQCRYYDVTMTLEDLG
jgi:hypothetical protein